MEVNFLEQSKCSLKDQTHDLKAVLDSNIPLLKRGLYCYSSVLLAEINTFVILFWGITYDNRLNFVVQRYLGVHTVLNTDFKTYLLLIKLIKSM